MSRLSELVKSEFSVLSIGLNLGQPLRGLGRSMGACVPQNPEIRPQMPRDVDAPQRPEEEARKRVLRGFPSSSWLSSWENQLHIPEGTVRFGTLVGCK